MNKGELVPFNIRIEIIEFNGESLAGTKLNDGRRHLIPLLENLDGFDGLVVAAVLVGKDFTPGNTGQNHHQSNAKKAEVT